MASTMTVRPLAAPGGLVCGLAGLLRARLLVAFYHRLTGLLWHQFAARIYCLLIPAFLFWFYSTMTNDHIRNTDDYDFWKWYTTVRLAQYFINVLASLYTEERYVLAFCTRVDFTDVTLDSASIFFKLEKRIKSLGIFFIVNRLLHPVLYCFTFGAPFSMSLSFFLILELAVNLNFTSKWVVVAVLRARLRVLRARLARHGFRRARDCALGRNVYCDVYVAILDGFNNIQRPMKTLMAIDLVCDVAALICMACAVFAVKSKSVIEYAFLLYSIGLVTAGLVAVCSELEGVAGQVEAIRQFAVNELIKQPSDRERRAIHELLALTAAAPARVALCRAVNVDARLALAALAFCTGRVVLVLQITK